MFNKIRIKRKIFELALILIALYFVSELPTRKSQEPKLKFEVIIILNLKGDELLIQQLLQTVAVAQETEYHTGHSGNRRWPGFSGGGEYWI